MSTRFFFASAVAACLATAVIFGGVLAWRTSDPARGAALVGSNGLEIRYEPHCEGHRPVPADLTIPADEEEATDRVTCLSLIGPNGARALVGKGSAANTGDFVLRVTGGSVRVTHVFARDAAVDEARGCVPDNFSGAVRVTGNPVVAPGETGAEFAATLSVAPDAPRSCQGDIVLYRVTIEAENPLPRPDSDESARDSVPAPLR